MAIIPQCEQCPLSTQKTRTFQHFLQPELMLTFKCPGQGQQTASRFSYWLMAMLTRSWYLRQMHSSVPLQSTYIIYMDGTFSSCPALWDQEYILHTRSGSVIYALVYALLPNRQIETYRTLSSPLKMKIQDRLNLTLDPAPPPPGVD